MTTNTLPSEVLGVRVLDSKLATAAIETAAAVSPDFLLSHSLRVFAFGSLLCARNGREFDPELGFVAAPEFDPR